MCSFRCALIEQGGTNVLATNEVLALGGEEYTIPMVGPRRPRRLIRLKAVWPPSKMRVVACSFLSSNL